PLHKNSMNSSSPLIQLQAPSTTTIRSRPPSSASSSPSGVLHPSGSPAGGFIDAATLRRNFFDKRMSFRLRGSLGPTIASAPSVEQEDYRTPKPSFDIIKNGKSFDFGGHQQLGPKASDSNGLIQVSADFLRLNGSRQQFRNLLSNRKKLGSMPPAYTRIDCSRESLDSNQAGNRLASGGGHHGPVITVEDTGSQLRINRVKTSITSSLIDSQHASFDKGGAAGGQVAICFSESNGSAGNHASAHNFKRNNSRYGVPVDSNQVKLVYRVRSERLNNRVKIIDRALFLALVGIFVMVVESEMTGQRMWGMGKDHAVSLVLRAFVALTTMALLTQIIQFHHNEIMLDLVDCGADDWRVVMTGCRWFRIAMEMIFCAVCPLPGTGHLRWSYIETNRNSAHSHKAFETQDVPLDVLLSVVMLCRVYLVARFMVLHSKQFQDASTRTLAALNRIQVNFSFVVKTVLDEQPLVFLTIFTVIFWLASSWCFVLCERYGRAEKDEPSILYSNALWFIAITFMLNGYGDIVPATHAGRILAIFVGVVGAIISSILIAVISRNIQLSNGQRNVNNFMNDSRLTREHKNAAARVLQHTWHIHTCLRSSEPSSDAVLRLHQRRFLNAIHRFRAIKNEIRIFGENNSVNTQQVTRLVAEMHSSMQKLVSAQEEMKTQIEVLQRAVRNHFIHHQHCSVSVANNVINNNGVAAVQPHQQIGQRSSRPGSGGSPQRTPPTAMRSDSYHSRRKRAFTIDHAN
ncbi:hypothetical protein PENTCL1PPCAC_27287, partial [Pristionchus entomophagus]